MKKSNTAATAAQTTTITRGQAKQMINDLPNGRFFNVTCRTKNNPARVMTAIKKEGISDPETNTVLPANASPAQKAAHTRRANGYITVWDMFAKGPRAVDTRTISELKCGGNVYNVR